MSLINDSDFEGKTISKIDSSAVNCTTFYFTDGTEQTLEAALMIAHLGLYGIQQQKTDAEGK